MKNSTTKWLREKRDLEMPREIAIVKYGQFY